MKVWNKTGIGDVSGGEAAHWTLATHHRRAPVNRVIYIIGLIVIVLAILSFAGLR